MVWLRKNLAFFDEDAENRELLPEEPNKPNLKKRKFRKGGRKYQLRSFTTCIREDVSFKDIVYDQSKEAEARRWLQVLMDKELCTQLSYQGYLKVS